MRPPSAGLPEIAAKHLATVQWNGIQFPQIPNALFIVYQKNSDVYNLNNPVFGVGSVNPPTAADHSTKWETIPAGALLNARRLLFDTHVHANEQLMDRILLPGSADLETAHTFNQELAGRYIAQNQASNASIMAIEITVQSAVGSWSFKSSAYPRTRDRDDLWQKHVMNCNDQYCLQGRGKWQDKCSCAYLTCSDWLLGIQSSPGTIFPIILDIKVEFAGRSTGKGGLCYTNGQTRGQQVFDDFICGSPCVVGIFNQQILSIASSSAVVSSQAFSQSTTAAALAQQG